MICVSHLQRHLDDGANRPPVQQELHRLGQARLLDVALGRYADLHAKMTAQGPFADPGVTGQRCGCDRFQIVQQVVDRASQMH